MVGGTKAISPCVKSASKKLFLDLHTMSAPSGEERTLDAAAQVERAGRRCRRFDSDTQTWCGSVTVMVLRLGLNSLRAARARLHSRMSMLRAVPRKRPIKRNSHCLLFFPLF